MARIKQATPVRREPSSEYASKHDRAPKAREQDAANGKANGVVSNGGGSASSNADKAPVAKKEAGIVTLIIDVAGIYASL